MRPGYPGRTFLERLFSESEGPLFFFLGGIQIQDTLVGASPPGQVGGAQRLDVRSVHEDVDILQETRQMGGGADLLDGEASPAPDGLVGFPLYLPGQGGESLHLVEGVSPGERNIGDVVRLDDSQEGVYAHLVSCAEVPALGVVATGTVVCAARAIDGRAEARSVDGRLAYDIQDTDFVAHSVKPRTVPSVF